MTRHVGDAEVAAALEEQIRRARLIMIASIETYARLCLTRKFLSSIDEQAPARQAQEAHIRTPHTQKEWLSHIIAKRARCGVTFRRQQVLVWAVEIIQASRGQTPAQTISRCLQELRDDGIIAFVDNNGTYRRLR